MMGAAVRALQLVVLLPLAACAAPPAAPSAPTSSTALTAAPAPRPPPEAPPPGVSSQCPAGMQLIEGGSHSMGSAKGEGAADEQPSHVERVATFCLDATEVTVEAYLSCARNGVCDPLSREARLGDARQEELRSALCSAALEANAKLPATCVPYLDAERYCKWLGARLPTELELEYVASGGEDRLRYPWGNAPPQEGQQCWRRPSGPCPVGSTAVGPFQLFDIAGNVREWTSTPYGPYPDPPASAETYAVRGGSFFSQQEAELRAKRRQHASPETRDADLGFRCAKSR